LSAEVPPSGEGGCDEAIQLFFSAAKLDCFAEPVIGRAFARPVGSQWRGGGRADPLPAKTWRGLRELLAHGSQ
jgi:hypothetical protein